MKAPTINDRLFRDEKQLLADLLDKWQQEHGFLTIYMAIHWLSVRDLLNIQKIREYIK